MVVYDESTTDPNSLSSNNTAYLVIMSLRKMGRTPLLLKGTPPPSLSLSHRSFFSLSPICVSFSLISSTLSITCIILPSQAIGSNLKQIRDSPLPLSTSSSVYSSILPSPNLPVFQYSQFQYPFCSHNNSPFFSFLIVMI